MRYHVTKPEPSIAVNYFRFVSQYRRLVLFGVVLVFFSSFGQTFFISLTVPGILEAFSLSNARFGMIYSLATLASGITLFFAGTGIDTIPLKKYALIVAAGLAASALVLGVSNGLIMLIAGLFGLRLFGQGLCTHTAQTAMGRYFTTLRGKALSVSSLGFTMGEALLPVTFVFIIGWMGWRNGWLLASIVIAVLLPTIILLTLRKDPEDSAEPVQNRHTDDNESRPLWRRSTVLRDHRFYLMLPGVLLAPFLLTGLFLYQTQLAGYKGWDIEWLASAFIAFAAARSLFALISGSLTDRFTACRMFPFFLLPLLIGMFVLLYSQHPSAAFVYLFLAGTSEGFAANVKTALFAELYGTANLGTIRSMISMFMVFGTAASPILFGYALDAGLSFGKIIQMAILLTVLVLIPASRIFKQANHTLS